MKLKIPLWSFDRTPNQHSDITWWTLGVDTAKRSEIWKDEIPDKVFLFGILKRYDAYYDGPIITWELGPLFVNYRW